MNIYILVISVVGTALSGLHMSQVKYYYRHIIIMKKIMYILIYIYIYNALFQYILNAKKNIGIGKNGRYVIINNIKNDPFAKIERNNLHGKYLNDTINEEIYASKISKLVIKNDITFGNFEYENPILAALNHSTTIIADECSMKGEVLLYYIIY